MGKTKKVYDVDVFFTKGESMSWKGVEDFSWEEGDGFSFLDSNRERVDVSAPTQLVVVRERMVPTIS